MATVIRSVPKYANGTLSPEALFGRKNKRHLRKGQQVAPGPGEPGWKEWGGERAQNRLPLQCNGAQTRGSKAIPDGGCRGSSLEVEGKMGRGAHAPAPEKESVSLPSLFLVKWRGGLVLISGAAPAGGRQAALLGPFPSFSRTEPIGRGSILLAYAKKRAERRRQARGRLLPVGSGEG